MELKRMAPWNWFRHEEEQERSVPVTKVGPSGGTPSMLDTMMPGFPGNFESLVNSFFGDRLRDFTGLTANNTPLGAFGVLKPQVDLRAEENEYILSAEIPGVDENDISINIMEGVMTISGEKKQEQEQKGKNYYRMERSYGSFQRILSLPDDVDQDHITANFKNGVLKVTMPRQQVITQQAKPIKITSS